MSKSTKTIRVWDPFVRLFHWSLVAGMIAVWVTSSSRDDTHQWIGFVVAGLIAARIIWGFFGTHYARFTQFIKSPRTTASYLFAILKGSERRYLGHNPAGAVMIVALLVSIVATTLTGWLMTTDRFYGDDTMQALHSACAYGVIALAIIHVGGVILASRHHNENLVAAMITGNKRAPASEDLT